MSFILLNIIKIKYYYIQNRQVLHTSENCCTREPFQQSDIGKWDASFAGQPTLISTNKTKSFLNIPWYQRCQHRSEWWSPFLRSPLRSMPIIGKKTLDIDLRENKLRQYWCSRLGCTGTRKHFCDRISLFFISRLYQKKNSPHGYWRTEIRTFAR